MLFGSSPASVIADSVARHFMIPVEQLLRVPTRLFHKRQAELDSWGRLSSPMDFEWILDPVRERKPPRSVIVVDDFITTGHTVREAARTLKLGGIHEVYVVGLGARVDSAATPSDASEGFNKSLAC